MPQYVSAASCVILLQIRQAGAFLASCLKPRTTGGKCDLRWQCGPNCHLLVAIITESSTALERTSGVGAETFRGGAVSVIFLTAGGRTGGGYCPIVPSFTESVASGE